MNRLKPKTFSLSVCLLPLLMLPGLASAAAGCTGWGSDTTRTVSLGLPAVVSVDASGGLSAPSGTVTINPLTCSDTSGNPVTSSSLNWFGGSLYNSTTRQIAPGVGLKLVWSTNQSSGTLDAAGGNASTQGLNWTRLDWTLTRLPGGIATGTTSLSSPLLSIAVHDPTVATGTRTLNLQPGVSALSLTANCSLSVSNNGQVRLPSADASDVARNGYGSSTAFSAVVACPTGMTLSSGSTLTLSTTATDMTDGTLVGNTGQAKGVAIEVLDGQGNRVSATNGAVNQTSFTGSTSQAFSARIRHVTGKTVSPGSVQGTATLTLTVN